MLRFDSKVFGGTMLIAGTSIGAAMLAMPIMTGLFGFFGTLVILFLCWAFMYWMATIILEASLQFDDGVSFITMAREMLGRGGALVTWVVFLLFFYALVAAYLSGSGSIIIDSLEGLIHVELPPMFDVLPLLVLFAPFIYFGLSLVDHLNRYLMIGMGLAYVVIIAIMLPNIEAERLLYTNWSFSLLSFSVVVTSFGYHVIIPTLVTYLDHDVARVKRCIYYGSIIPLAIYLIWEAAILGSVPVAGPSGLFSAFIHNEPLARILRVHGHSDVAAALARAFSMFAIVTSFLGVAQGLFDFLKDGLRAHHSHRRRMLAFILTFLPPVAFIALFGKGFIVLLEYAGALISIILGIIPILIVWKLRNAPRRAVLYRARGSSVSLILGILFFSFVVGLVLLKNGGVLDFGSL